MTDFARELFARTLAAPYRTKVVEKVRLPTREERERILAEAGCSPVFLDSGDVFIDLITDSGTSAMSDEQWAALMRGDEAYMQSKSYKRFEAAVREVTGFEHVVPTHQGRAAENILMELLVDAGDIVLSNTHFDTTRAHVENRKALPVDLVGDALWNFQEAIPFKGNFDLAKLEAALARHHERVALVVVTILNNFACSSPVSLENIREVRRLADKHQIPLFLDACRFAENAWFVRELESGQRDRTVRDIVREMMSLADGCWVSAKKDAMTNIGGFIATRDQNLAQRARERLVLYEGFPSYGGLARRDLEAIAVGLEEALDQDYLAHRVGQVRYLAEAMERKGAVVSRPAGGSGVFLDVGSIYPHLPPEKNPTIALCADYYLEGGIRIGAAPFPMHTVSAKTGEIEERMFQFARLAIPRRVYGTGHLDYVAEVTKRVLEVAPQNRGYALVERPEVLGHFFARFTPITH